MEGLIPLLYRAIVHQKNGKHSISPSPLDPWLHDSPSAPYTKLPTESKPACLNKVTERIQEASSPRMGSSLVKLPSPASASIIVSSGVQPSLSRLTSRRVSV
ncbi:hypothetical protein MLD38_032625 [Melastoma candidum]|uniref:Uncharacterized protein n=1 Tax=Melastoma candidum TaxID=119954 RepID=A0ACB9M437_9MYRT|nr:hypothetical protein MLD38_032625 [Melastoma candidum]